MSELYSLEKWKMILEERIVIHNISFNQIDMFPKTIMKNVYIAIYHILWTTNLCRFLYALGETVEFWESCEILLQNEACVLYLFKARYIGKFLN